MQSTQSNALTKLSYTSEHQGRMAESWKRAAKQVSCSEIRSFIWFLNPSFASSKSIICQGPHFFFQLGSKCSSHLCQTSSLAIVCSRIELSCKTPLSKAGPRSWKSLLALAGCGKRRKVTKKQTCSSHKLEIICKLEECFTAELPPLIHPSKLIPLQENERSSSSHCNEKKSICSANIYAAVAFCQVDSLPCRSKLSSRRRSSDTLDERNWQKSLG